MWHRFPTCIALLAAARSRVGHLWCSGTIYFADHAKSAGVTTPKLLSYEGTWGSGEEYAYEALKLHRRQAHRAPDP